MHLELAEWRRLTAEMYAAARGASAEEVQPGWQEFVNKRSEMFRAHPQSPLSAEQRKSFKALHYFPYNPAWRFRVSAEPIEDSVASRSIAVELPEGKASLLPFARISFASVRLTLFWVQGYGGGLFLPFKDRTNSAETYGGGRYLYDTIKGADLGASADTMLLDFNFAYNPSCAYSPQWTCPLAPAENSLPLRIEAGELAFEPARARR